ncbi:hypothetical protein, partial [Actinocorallia lasiicapitis]
GRAAADLHDLLRSRRLRGLRVGYGHGLAVLSVPPDLSVWVHPGEIIASGPLGAPPASFSLHDTVEVAERLVSWSTRGGQSVSCDTA